MTITIPGELTHLNAYIDAERTNRYVAAQIKARETSYVSVNAKKQKAARVVHYPVTISFHWYTKNARVDCDNISFARKFILDGLVRAGVLDDDDRKHIKGFGGEEFTVDAANPRVEIFIS